jgi:hypothetical protein
MYAWIIVVFVSTAGTWNIDDNTSGISDANVLYLTEPSCAAALKIRHPSGNAVCHLVEITTGKLSK